MKKIYTHFFSLLILIKMTEKIKPIKPIEQSEPK